MDLLTGSYENVHRRMAGKLCGPSSSKASPASTPIPLGTAKNTRYIEKMKSIRARNTTTRVYTHNATNAYVILHTHTYVHIPQTFTHRRARAQNHRTHEDSCDARKKISYESAALLSAKSFTFEQTGTKESPCKERNG